MSLIRVQTVWTGVAGAPYYTNLYTLGPLSTNNGQQCASFWRAFLASIIPNLTVGLTATIDAELIEFDESTGNVTGAGVTTQAPVVFTGTGSQLPHQDQALVRWTTEGIVHNRRVKGRTFIPGVREEDSSPAGLPLANLGTPLQTAIDTYLSSMSGRARVWSRPLEKDPPDPKNPNRPGSAHAIVSGSVAPYWAVLRSRRD